MRHKGKHSAALHNKEKGPRPPEARGDSEARETEREGSEVTSRHVSPRVTS